jgi:hypothetical protein
MRVAGAEARERLIVARHGERVVRAMPRKLHGPADHDALRIEVEGSVGMADEGAQERREQIFEPIAIPKDARFLKRGARCKSLERLDETVGVASLQELLHRVGPTLDLRDAARAVVLVPEAQRRHIDVEACPIVPEANGLRRPVGARERYDRVAGTKVDADRYGVGGGPHGQTHWLEGTTPLADGSALGQCCSCHRIGAQPNLDRQPGADRRVHILDGVPGPEPGRQNSTLPIEPYPSRRGERMAAIVGARTPSGWASRALTMCRWPTRFVGACGLWFL